MADRSETVLATPQQLQQALAGAGLLRDDLRGDLKRAADIAAAMCTTAAADQLADAWLGRAIVALQAGDAGLAVRACDRAEAAAGSDATRRLLVAMWRHLAVIAQYNTLPDGGGAGGAEIAARWSGVEFAEQSHTRVQRLLAQVTDASTRQLVSLALGPIAGLPTVRYLALSSRFTPPPPGQAEAFAQMMGRTAEQLLELAPMLPGLAVASSDLAWRRQDPAQAESRLQAAEAAFAKGGNAAGLGLCALLRGDRLAAPSTTPLAMNLLPMDSGSESSDLAWPYEAAEGRRDGIDAFAASAHYARAEALFAQAAAPRGLAAVQLRHAWLSSLNGDAAAAAETAEAAARAFAAAGDSASAHLAAVHAALYRIAMPERAEDAAPCSAAGHWGTGDGSFSQALGLGVLCCRVARDWVLRRGDVERALAGYRLAEALFEALGAPLNVAQCEVDQGRCAKLFGERRMALTLFDRALDQLAADERARPAAGTDLAMLRRYRVHGLATTIYQVHLGRRDADGMERAAARFAQLAADVPPPDVDAMRQAAPAELVALALAQHARDTLRQAVVLVPLYRAVDARADGDMARADALFAQASDAARGADVASALLQATVLAQQRRYAEAMQAHERYLAQGGPDAGGFGAIAERLAGQGGAQGAAEAEAQRRRALEQRFAFLAVCKAWPQARAALDALLAVAGPDWWRSGDKPWEKLFDRAELEEGEGNLATALTTLALAIETFESRRALLRRDDLKLSMAGERGAQWMYFSAARIALADGGPAESFAYQEAGRARALLDLMAGARPVEAVQAEDGDDVVGRWRQAHAELALQRGLLAQARESAVAEPARIATLEQAIDTGEARVVEIEHALARSHPLLARALGGEGRTLTLDEACAALPAGTLLLSLSFLGQHLLAWALTRDGLAASHVAAVEAEGLTRRLREFHRACAARRPAGAVALDLAQTFLEPFADLLRRHSRVVFVPYGAAHLLPLAALPFDGRPLGATHAISVLPSASMLHHVAIDARLPEGAATPALIVGNPELNLPGAELEAASVAALYGETALLREKATLAAVVARLPGRRVLHFAAHGELSESAPLASALRLAGGEALSVHRLAGLRLSADLVVLSACETGRSETTGGDDLVGLARALLAAGARAAVVSLWPVDDASAALLMQRFHRALVGGLPPAQALQQAIVVLQGMDPAARDSALAALRTAAAASPLPDRTQERRFGSARAIPRDDVRQPFHWAPFILVG